MDPTPDALCPGCFTDPGGTHPCPHCGYAAARRARTLTLLLAALWGPAMAADDPSVASDYQAVAGHTPAAGDPPIASPAPTDPWAPAPTSVPVVPAPATVTAPLVEAPPPRHQGSLDLRVQPVPPSTAVPAPESLSAPAPDPVTPPLGQVAEPVSGPGSAAILAACWTPEQLKGRPGERKIKQRLPADHSPPERLLARHPYPPLGGEFARSLRSVTPVNGRKLIALTFDLCEQSNEVTGYDGELVDTLRAANAKATFYAGGKWMRSHPERTRQLMADPLFELGNHAWTHGNLRVLDGREMEDQIHWTQAQYELLREDLLARPCAQPHAAAGHDSIPVLPQTFRYPYGTCNATSLAAVAAAGLYPVQWSIVTGDPAAGQSAAQIVRGVLASLKPGAIVVAHGNGRGWHTAEAMKTLIPALRKRGYDLVTVSELIAAGTPHLVDECYEEKPGDNHRYDKLFGKGTE
ncbi:polysaccharide deacetylase family protein [Candidatus Thiodictyon syntrophicum]|uniref:NodB homology domain-containing protein n=1 Tax=Candidatus Thiodictyon syntrophicum TaxID=1166950 RepID=A0A2K8U885_9GAMM|nr:polysaccharide deacetylase family protein [Candidatus Thiodictyon syntrophicum]AUB81619.1 hypothetical protein THSYN_12055 [Candidatus Thiodictyon syntrophicum]